MPDQLHAICRTNKSHSHGNSLKDRPLRPENSCQQDTENHAEHGAYNKYIKSIHVQKFLNLSINYYTASPPEPPLPESMNGEGGIDVDFPSANHDGLPMAETCIVEGIETLKR